MYRKILIGGVTAAAIVGAGGTALAVTGSDSPATPKAGSSSTAKHDGAKKHHKGSGSMLRHLDYGTFVTTGKDGKSVTHDLIRGTVTAVSSSSITVQAKDKKSETFTVDKDTKVRERTAGQKGSAKAATIGDLAKGDHVLVAGTGTTSFVAKHIAEVTKK